MYLFFQHIPKVYGIRDQFVLQYWTEFKEKHIPFSIYYVWKMAVQVLIKVAKCKIDCQLKTTYFISRKAFIFFERAKIFLISSPKWRQFHSTSSGIRNQILTIYFWQITFCIKTHVICKMHFWQISFNLHCKQDFFLEFSF